MKKINQPTPNIQREQLKALLQSDSLDPKQIQQIKKMLKGNTNLKRGITKSPINKKKLKAKHKSQKLARKQSHKK